MRKLPGQETKRISFDEGIGIAAFADGRRENVKYSVELFKEFQDGHPFRSWFECNVNTGDQFFAARNIGKDFVLELSDGKKLSMFIVNKNGKAEHSGNVVHGFPSLHERG